MADALYFIQNEDGTVKIGRARDVKRRLQTLQTSFPGQLRVIGIVLGAGSREQELHERFAHLHLRGEWFRPDAALLTWIKESSNADLSDFAVRPQRQTKCEDTRICAERVSRMVLAYSKQNGVRHLQAQKAIAEALGWPVGGVWNLLRGRTKGLLASEVRDVNDVFAAFLQGEIDRVAAEMDAARLAGLIDSVSLEEAADALASARRTMSEIKAADLAKVRAALNGG